MSKSVPLAIQGCPVYFPHKPYPSQMSMMSRIIQALDKKQNCLLESPTGSGKTLALLCATLAWVKREIETQEKAIADRRNQLDELQFNPEDCCPMCGPTTSTSVLEMANETSQCPSPHQSPIIISDSEDEDKEPEMKRARIYDPDEDDFQEKSLRGSDLFKDTKARKKEERNLKSCRTDEKDLKSLGTDEKDLKSLGTDEKDLKSRGKNEKDLGLNVSCEECSCHLVGLEGPDSVKAPTIFYTSRTHNQIQQVVHEMQRTQYSSMKSTVLSSREHTCVNESVATLHQKNDRCRELVKDGACSFHDKVKTVDNHSKLKKNCDLEGAWDIEDLVTALRSVNACPYFAARELMSSANIVFAPYNYIIDPTIRRSASLHLKDSIIIFDEAHNIENCCSDAASFDITLQQLENAKKDLKSLISFKVKPDSHEVLLKLVENMMTVMELAKPRLIRQDFDAAHLTWSGQEIVALMERVGIGPNQLLDVKKHFNNVMDENDKESAKNRHKSVKSRMEMATANVFECLFLILGFIFNDKMKHMDDYHAALVQTTEYSREENTPDALSGMWLGKRRSKGPPRLQERQVLTLSFWCMNPHVAFKLVGEDARSIILTSGTLSPLDSFASELGFDFPVRLEANHVVKTEQTLIGTIGSAPSGGVLCGTYQNYMTFRFQDDLGSFILSMCRMVPHGVLCFVPSYHIVEKMMERWTDTGLLGQLRRVKEVLVEPRRAAEMSSVISDFYTCIRDTAQLPMNGVSGAFLLAVCRGKMSEGQDFSDDYARLVITIGIPYPSIKEPRINLKRSYNDKRRNTNTSLLTGSQWYEVQAFRALNQALGRCIRHRDDWGAVIMVDTRLTGPRFMPRISRWLRQRVEHFDSFRALAMQVEEFVDKRTAQKAAVKPECGDVNDNLKMNVSDCDK